MDTSRLLTLLKEHAATGEYLSGEDLSKLLKISRTAVWKQINKLREEGYEFDAVSRRGYRLLHAPDLMTAERLERYLQTKLYGRKLQLLSVTSSTQIVAKELAEEGEPEGTLVFAEQQTVGRGRQGRSWHSPAGKGIWMSLVLRPELPLRSAPQLTLMTAVAVCLAIRKVTGVEAGIKWPNDLLAGGKKICGILLESAGEDTRMKYCIAGIGIDVNLEQEDLPEHLQGVATSLKLAAGQTQDRAELAAEVLLRMEQLMELYQAEGFQPIRLLWEDMSVTLGRGVSVAGHQGMNTGRAVALDDSGGLVILDESGALATIFSGELELD
ncbi:biotin--[acetyl-CoA-carboxylase] ligase [Paenibacillus antibioticophila]|uniref:biotin--[acetyl-CoA-carboxylase] ligase n=1 Tax=Paenibacillus antibioticophila TaxID=1274374 RepID=UPI0005CB1A15|nr:biotin--[acetyl-CoA-carboxylase] ligase [Paenibacillus antibioticophila]